MVDMSAIAGVMASLNAAVNITKAMKDLSEWSAVQSKVIELQGAILEAQSNIFAANEERSALIEKVGTLEKEVATLKAWEAEKQRYELKELRTGLFAYALKEEMKGTEPIHELCAECYQKGEKSLLQSETRFPGRCQVKTCHRCGSDLYISGAPHPDHFKNRVY